MECLTPRYIAKSDVVVSCGNCAFCTATRRSDWATRLHYESKLHRQSLFVTLTYANAHLTYKNGSSQLVKSDLQKYFKKVRKAGYKIRYYAVGEYGSKTFRPHYHLLLFGDVPEDVVRSCWDKGLVHIGKVTQASILYTLGYIVNGKGWKMRAGRVPPFSVMSRKPGLGANYLTKEMVAWHHSDRKNYVVLDGAKRHLPRYYKGKIFSKIDHVRIAVRDQKASFKRKVKWLRSPRQARMKDPLAVEREALRRLSRLIRDKTKSTQTI